MARDFNGTTDRIDWATVFTTSGQAFTISLWAMFDVLAPATSGYLFHVGSPGNTIGTLLAQLGGANGELTFTRNGSTAMTRTSALDTVTTATWTHVLLTMPASLTVANSHLYKNGVEVSYLSAGVNGVSEFTANGEWSLGGRLSDDIRNFNGKQAEIGVWNRVLTAPEIADLAAKKAPTFIPSGLMFYASLIGDPINAIGSVAPATIDGTTLSTHLTGMEYPVAATTPINFSRSKYFHYNG